MAKRDTQKAKAESGEGEVSFGLDTAKVTIPPQAESSCSGLSESMVSAVLPPSSVAAGGPAAWEAFDFSAILTELLGPCANTTVIIEILKRLGLNSIILFSRVVGNMNDAELKIWVREQLKEWETELFCEDEEHVVSRFLMVRNILGSRLLRERVCLPNRPVVPTRVYPQSDKVSYPHLLSALVLVNSGDGKLSREKAFSPLPPKRLKAEPYIDRSEGSAGVRPVHFHAPKPRPVGTGGVAPGGAAPQVLGLSLVDTLAFYTACLFQDFSPTFKFCASAAYQTEDVADFIVRSLRNRARSDTTLGRVSKLVGEFYSFATAINPPFPFCGQESLIAVSKWLEVLRSRGKTVPQLGRYALKVYGEALGVVSPTDHPAVLQAVTIVRNKQSSAPGLETEFVLALDAGANDKASPSGKRLYCALFT